MIRCPCLPEISRDDGGFIRASRGLRSKPIVQSTEKTANCGRCGQFYAVKVSTSFLIDQSSFEQNWPFISVNFMFSFSILLFCRTLNNTRNIYLPQEENKLLPTLKSSMWRQSELLSAPTSLMSQLLKYSREWDRSQRRLKHYSHIQFIYL